MIEIIPNWHPILVHFAIGLLITAAALFAASALLRNTTAALRATIAARWNLWIGGGFAVLALIAGYRAFYTVAHDDPAHTAMLLHMKWAWAALILFLTAAALAWRERAKERGAGSILAMFLAAGVGALLVTGYLGAENVYRHGLGVMRLPAAEGPGHGHEHGDGGPGYDPAVGDNGHAHEHAEQPAAERVDESLGHAHAQQAPPTKPANNKTLTPAAAEAAALVDAFHRELTQGNLDRARQLLDAHVQVFESGNVERSAEEYASHHLPNDAAFLKDAEISLLSRSGDAVGDQAWIATESTVVPRGREGIVSTETMVLRNLPEGWRIAHIHWSSRPVPAVDRDGPEAVHDHDHADPQAAPDGEAVAPDHDHGDHRPEAAVPDRQP